MNFTSHSQAGQDRFVLAVLNGKTDGFYVDIGCSHPVELSNTFSLEQLGWRGIGIDSDQNCIDLHNAFRKNIAICGDATKIDWESRFAEIRPLPPHMVSYASVDVDPHTHEALKRLMELPNRFQVISCEHDFYARGETLRIPNRELLKARGYDLIAADVHSQGCCFEDWFCDPYLVDMSQAEKFRSNGLEWQDVLRQGGAL